MLMSVPVKKAIDLPTRRRVAAYLQRYLDRNQMTREQLEAKLELGSGTISRVLMGRSLGLDVVLKINRKLMIDAEDLLNRDPPPYKQRPE